MTKIFINYRTGDGERAPELVDERLVGVFGEGNVFRDRRAMRPGTDFPDYLRRELESCTVFLSLIGRRWIDIRDEETGMRRIDVPKDYVHDEIATALALNKVVIPVLLDAALPRVEELPSALVGLANRQVMHLREGYAHHDLDILTDELRRHVPEKEKEPERRRDAEAGFSVGSNAHFFRSPVGNKVVYNENATSRDQDGDGRWPA
ncbi:toll/interleukin-1 receptor domain-containing protein [Streptomyces sp. NPDC048291]|uniref:toll/interleukin-1 receptor domain-containing protein n=1 Tax=Streptomyces sp. NPDC048291 TaxID=3365530 RepID=UPI00371629D3